MRVLWVSENGENLLMNKVMLVSLIQEQWRTYVWYICPLLHQTYLWCWYELILLTPFRCIFNILPGFLWTNTTKNNQLWSNRIYKRSLYWREHKVDWWYNRLYKNWKPIRNILLSLDFKKAFDTLEWPCNI